MMDHREDDGEYVKIIDKLFKCNNKHFPPHLNFRTLVDFQLSHSLNLTNSEKRHLKLSDISIFPLQHHDYDGDRCQSNDIMVFKSGDKFVGCLRNKYINNCLHTCLAMYLFTRIHMVDNHGVTEKIDGSKHSTPTSSPLLSQSTQVPGNSIPTLPSIVDAIPSSTTALPGFSSVTESRSTSHSISPPPLVLPDDQHIHAKIQRFIDSKLLKGNNKLQSISYSQQYKAQLKALKISGIPTTTTQIHDNFDTSAYYNGHNINIGQLITNEGNKVPTSANINNLPHNILVENAGFQGENYHLIRNIDPPQQLVDLIFPFINDDSKFDIFTIRIKNVLSSLRKCLIQDMVIIKKYYPENPIVNHSIFKSSIFLKFCQKFEDSGIFDNQVNFMPKPTTPPSKSPYLSGSSSNSPFSSSSSSNTSLKVSHTSINNMMEVQIRHQQQLETLTNQVNSLVSQQYEICNYLKQFMDRITNNNDSEDQENNLKEGKELVGKLSSNILSSINNPIVPDQHTDHYTYPQPQHFQPQHPRHPPVSYPFPYQSPHLTSHPTPPSNLHHLANSYSRSSHSQHITQQNSASAVNISPHNQNAVVHTPSQYYHQPERQQQQQQQQQISSPIPPTIPSLQAVHGQMPLPTQLPHAHQINQVNASLSGPLPGQLPGAINPMMMPIPIMNLPSQNQPTRFFENDQMMRRHKALNRRLSRQATTVYEMWDDFKSLENELEKNEISITEWLKLHGSSERQFRHTRSKIIRFIESESSRTGKTVDEIKHLLHCKMRDRIKPWTLDEVQRMLTSGKKINLQ